MFDLQRDGWEFGQSGQLILQIQRVCLVTIRQNGELVELGRRADVLDPATNACLLIHICRHTGNPYAIPAFITDMYKWYPATMTRAFPDVDVDDPLDLRRAVVPPDRAHYWVERIGRLSCLDLEVTRQAVEQFLKQL